MKRLFAATALGALLLASNALANLVVASTTPVAVTLGSGGTFQTVLAQNSNRAGCTIQNTSSDMEYVFFGPTANATEAASIQLQPSQTLTCGVGDMVPGDNIAMAGAASAGDTALVQSQ